MGAAPIPARTAYRPSSRLSTEAGEIRSPPCRSVRSSPTTAVGPRPTASACVCGLAQAVRFCLRAAARAAPASLPDPVLPAVHRMRRRADFTAAVRTGRRASSPTLVLHVLARTESSHPVRVGLIVGKGVGGSVVRHQVARRLRGVCASRLGEFTPGDLVVIRALPDSAMATSAQLAADFEQALQRLSRRAPRQVAAV